MLDKILIICYIHGSAQLLMIRDEQKKWEAIVKKIIINIIYVVSLIILSGLILFVVTGHKYNHFESEQSFRVIARPIVRGNYSISRICLDEKDGDIRSKLKTIINSGKYNIVSVETIYSSSHLKAAEIAYNSSVRGNGNNMRILLLQQEDATSFKSVFNDTFGGGKHEIIATNIIYKNNHLLSAEIYYYQ